MAGKTDLDCLRHWRVEIPKGRVIYDAGEAPKAFYRVEMGCVRLQVNGDDGRRQILAFCLPGDVFGVDLERPRAMAAEAAAASELTRFPISERLGAAWRPEDWAGVVDASSKLVGVLAAHLMGLAHASAEERLMWFLDGLAARQGVNRANGALRPPMSRRDIADFLNLAPETLSRTFSRLVAQGLLERVDRRQIALRPRSLRASVRDQELRSAA